MKLGARDYIGKPFSPDELRLVVAARARRDQLKQAHGALTKRLAYGSMIGESPAMRQLRETIDKVAHSDATVLVTGESGTGKELVARALHFARAARERHVRARQLRRARRHAARQRAVRPPARRVHRRRHVEARAVRRRRRRHAVPRRDRRAAARAAAEAAPRAAGRRGQAGRRHVGDPRRRARDRGDQPRPRRRRSRPARSARICTTGSR